MPRVILFDVNETLLDLRALDPHFQRAFGDAVAREEWFAQVLHSTLVATVTDAYTDFDTIAAAALDMITVRRRISLPAADRAQILEGMRALPAHPEVQESLERLTSAGLRLATLTNSTAAVAEAQLAHAGLRAYFEQVLSVDAVRRFKPAAEAYYMAAIRLGVEIAEVRFVAAHGWDIAGALRAGCAAAFIARPGMVLDPLAEMPDIVGPDLDAVTTQILEIDMERM